MTDRVQEVIDRLELIELHARYAEALDQGSTEILDRVVTPDLVAEHGMVGETFGRDEVAALITQTPPGLVSTQHYVVNHQIELDGDEAEVRSYLYAVHVYDTADGPLIVPAGSRYENHARRTAEGWRLDRLRLVVTWTGPETDLLRALASKGA